MPKCSICKKEVPDMGFPQLKETDEVICIECASEKRF